MNEEYLTTDEVAARYRTEVETVRHWRKTGKGPRWVKPGRAVLYPISEIERFDKQLKQDAKIA